MAPVQLTLSTKMDCSSAVRLPLRAGEQVRVIVLRPPDPKRWNLERFSKLGKEEDLALSQEGIAQWCEELDREDRG